MGFPETQGSPHWRARLRRRLANGRWDPSRDFLDRETAWAVPRAGPAVESLDPPGHGTRSQRRQAIAAAVGSFGLLSALLAYAAYFPMHNQFQPYDDEGYWLISLRSYHLHGSLYHDTFAQVGPLYYEFWSLIYTITGLPIGPDTGRAFTLVVWVLTSLVFGISLFWLTRRLLLGLLAQALSFLLLLSLIYEPMEPAGLAHLFAACGLLGLVIAYRGRCRLGMALAGIFTMGAVLTKINVGLFLAGGIAYALVVCWPTEHGRRARRVVGAIALLAVPVYLMSEIVARTWVQRYLLIELCALVGLVAVIGIGRRPARPVAIRDILWCASAAAATLIVVVLGVLVNGTSLDEFVRGALLSQRGLARVATIPLPSTSIDVVLAGLAAALALVVVHRGYVPGAVVRLAVGCWLSISIVENIPNAPVAVPIFPSDAFVLAAPLAWIALVPRSRVDSTLSFERIAVCTAGVLGFLEAFPGAGSQRRWSCLLLVPVAVLCMSDGLDMLTTKLGQRVPSGTRQRTASLLVAITALVVLVPVGVPAAGALANDRSLYDRQPALGLPGAESLRLPNAEGTALRRVTDALKADCSAFESIPGLNSFYFFTQQDPPTDANTTQWWKLLGAQHEEAAVKSLERTPRPCVLTSLPLVLFWDTTGQDAQLKKSPLVRYAQTHLVPLGTSMGSMGYQLLGRRHPKPARR